MTDHPKSKAEGDHGQVHELVAAKDIFEKDLKNLKKKRAKLQVRIQAMIAVKCSQNDIATRQEESTTLKQQIEKLKLEIKMLEKELVEGPSE